MNKKVLLPILIIILVIGAAFVFWKVQDEKAQAAKLEEAKAAQMESEILKGLTAEEIILILENQSLIEPSRTVAVVETEETRKAFLNGLREYLSLASKARREGLAEDPNVKSVLEFKKNSLLANLYVNKLDNQHKGYYQVAKEQFESLWSNPENVKQFNAEIQALKGVQQSVATNTGNPHASSSDVQHGETSEKTRESWAKVKIISDMAKADTEFINQKAIKLRLKVVEAGVFTSNYLSKHWTKSIKVTDEEIAAYLTAHPEYDVNKKRETAEIVLQRVKDGEDFTKLAAEFSEDRSTKKKGGLYKDIEKGNFLWPEVQSTALGLEKGQIADKIVETKDGYHIIQLVDKSPIKNKDGDETVKYSVRHILLQKRFEEPGAKNPDIPPPFMSAKDIAQTEVQKEKRKRFIDEAIRTEAISLPDDFEFEITEEMRGNASQLQNLLDKANSTDKSGNGKEIKK